MNDKQFMDKFTEITGAKFVDLTPTSTGGSNGRGYRVPDKTILEILLAKIGTTKRMWTTEEIINLILEVKNENSTTN
jgi:hypothetical protein